MEFRKMVMIALYARQKKRHRCLYIHTFGLCGRRQSLLGGMIWENSIETCILSIVKQITSSGLMHETSAQGWYTRITQRDGMGREVGGFRMGNTCKFMADLYQCMAKPLQYYKVISLQLIKNEKKKQNK